MATRYNFRAQQEGEDDMTTAFNSLPGTASSTSVTHNETALKSQITHHDEMNGYHPSRLVYEILHNNLMFEDSPEEVSEAAINDVPFSWRGHKHRLVINGNQTYSKPGLRILSTICLDCLFHFVFTTTWELACAKDLCHVRQLKWPLPEDHFPWHHLVWAATSGDEETPDFNNKYNPLLVCESFACVASPCTFELNVCVSKPRFTASWLRLLSDQDAIREQLHAGRQHEPLKYTMADEDMIHKAPLTLNTYLKNLLESTADQIRSISKRNKRFAVLFGDRCTPIFRQLEFREISDTIDGVNYGAWSPPYPGDATGYCNTTEMGTYRSYIEDVRSELQCLIHKIGMSIERPSFCDQVLYANLGCQEVPGVSTTTVKDNPAYQYLGVLPSQSREIIVNAYRRQWEMLPSGRKTLVASLGAVAHETGDQALSDYAGIQSSLFESQIQSQSQNDDGVISQALKFLRLDPPNNHTAIQVIKAFRAKLIADPASAVTARSLLMMLARASSDDSYQASLLMEADPQMSLATSLAVLGLTPCKWSPDQAFEALKRQIATWPNYEAQETFFEAFDALTNHCDLPQLKHRGFALRQTPRSPKDPQDQDPHRSTAQKAQGNLSLPVGLENIGNTCYLNSLLQYLFTVKPIRDILANYDELRLDLSDESINSRLLGGNKMQMDRGEAVVAQAFARELATLFNKLQTSDKVATRPSQRLANAVLLSTHTLLQSLKPSPADSAAPMKPPPLPARKKPEAHLSEETEMEPDNSSPDQNVDDTTSVSSAKTLVGSDDRIFGDPFKKTAENEALQTADVGAFSPVEAAPPVDTQQSEDVKMADMAEAPEKMEISQSYDDDDNKQQDSDVFMADAPDAETIDQKVFDALEHQTRSSGTDQQDVEEVMGSILNRLQAAIKPSSVDEETGIQLEPIMETFFVTTVNYTKKIAQDLYQHEVSFDRSITAFPAEDGKCSLYEALGRNFDQQILKECMLSRHTSIRSLPPVLHVLIQRSQSTGGKNGNPVVIPETLYLDRFMDAPLDSPEFRRRVQDWAMTDRVEDIRAIMAQLDQTPVYLETLQDLCNGLESSPSSSPSGSEDENAAKEAELAAQRLKWSFDGHITDEEAACLLPTCVEKDDKQSSESDKNPPMKIDVSKTREGLQTLMENELRFRQETFEKHHDSLNKIAYRLHAVICHRGHMTSGHYWVWICDFEDHVWRRYNDAAVEENRDTAEVLNMLSTSGEPYFLCYVRDTDKETYVGVPRRQVKEDETTTSGVQGGEENLKDTVRQPVDEENLKDTARQPVDEEHSRGRTQSPKYRIE